AWLSLKPVTGRRHQLRAHMAHIGHPIVGDPKYFSKENWELPGGMQNRLHLLARRIVVPHPRGGNIDVTAPLPPPLRQSWRKPEPYRRLALILSSIADPGHKSFSERLLSGAGTVLKCRCRSSGSGST